MRVLETAATMTLDDEAVWVAGDWHGDVTWLQVALPALRRHSPGIRTILHLGDWWMNTKPVDYWAERAGIDRIFVTLGNHEPFDVYGPLMRRYPNRALRVSEVVWLLPRPFLFVVAGRRFLSVGGASSIDEEVRVAGKDWWPEERILEEHVAAASELPADVLLTHETPDRTPVKVVQELLDHPPTDVSTRVLRECALSRSRVDRIWDAVHPALLLHGHMHVFGRGRSADGREVISLNRNGRSGNVVRLEVATLTSTVVPIAPSRGA